MTANVIMSAAIAQKPSESTTGRSGLSEAVLVRVGDAVAGFDLTGLAAMEEVPGIMGGVWVGLHAGWQSLLVVTPRSLANSPGASWRSQRALNRPSG
jgi:hypothetical protein